MSISNNEISLYGSPASGRTMTENVTPIAAKKAMTHEVHPYVKIPNKTEKNPKLVALPSLPFSSTIDVDKFIKKADKKLIMMFKDIFNMTR